MTARVLEPGEKYFTGTKIATVPKGIKVIYCEVCGSAEQVPDRYGDDYVTQAREDHLKDKHRNDLTTGRAVL